MATRLIVRKTSMDLARDIAERLGMPAWERQKLGGLRLASLLAIARALDKEHAPFAEVPNESSAN